MAEESRVSSLVSQQYDEPFLSADGSPEKPPENKRAPLYTPTELRAPEAPLIKLFFSKTILASFFEYLDANLNELSVDPSSQIRSSQSENDWLRTESIASARNLSELYRGITIEIIYYLFF